ncbi:hypothetical protein [Bacillus sp. CGMCC 1.16541]|uniref:DUF6944 family repetitive protein n=1 Tax=Bacillus sp. CGMCC 1.16541 TaxID=2185143 RepID=UPI000D73D88F|nr:hypothetical protein [Bacillus sp. CGMCC 1.16541]
MTENKLIGSWLIAIGNTAVAIGTTRELVESSRENDNLVIVGNGFQALGNTISIDERIDSVTERVGSEIQAVGNVSVITGAVGNQHKVSVENDVLLVIGNGLQSVGAAIKVIGNIQDRATNQFVFLDVTGNSLQSIGAFIQALTGGNLLGSKWPGQKVIRAIGTWIQTSGAIIIAVKETI